MNEEGVDEGREGGSVVSFETAMRAMMKRFSTVVFLERYSTAFLTEEASQPIPMLTDVDMGRIR